MSVLLIASALLLPAPADAAADAQCLAAVAMMAERADELEQPAMMAGAMYFVGKLLDSHTPQQVSALVKAAKSGVTDASLPDIAKRCGAEITHAGEQLDF